MGRSRKIANTPLEHTDQQTAAAAFRKNQGPVDRSKEGKITPEEPVATLFRDPDRSKVDIPCNKAAQELRKR